MINKKMVKRLSAVMLAAALCITAAPNVAYATETPDAEMSTEVVVDSAETISTEVTTEVTTEATADSTEMTTEEVTESTDTTTEAVATAATEGTELVSEPVTETDGTAGGTETTDVATEGTEDADTVVEGTEAADTVVEGTEAADTVVEGTEAADTVVEGTETTDEVTDNTEAGETEVLPDDYVITNSEEGIPDASLYTYLLKKHGGDDGVLTYGETKNISEIFYEVTEEQAAVTSFKNVAVYLSHLSTIYYGINNVNATERVPITVENMKELKEIQAGKGIQEYGMKFSMNLWGVEMNQEAANVFTEMENLDNLSISHSTLPSYDFLKSENLAGLERLGLGFNGLETIPDISHMKELTGLYLRSNKLTDLPDLTAMESLNLDEMDLWENCFGKDVLMAKLPKHVTEDTELIASVLERQTREIECELTVGIETTEKNPVLTPGTTIPATVTVKNTGADLENVLVKLQAATCTGIYLPLCPTDYTLEEGNIRIPLLKHGEELTLQYELTTGEGALWEEDHLQFYAEVWLEADEYISDRADSYETYGWIYIREEEDNSGSGSGSGSGSYDTLEISATEVTVSNKELVVNDDAPTATVDLSVAVTGADADKLQAGDYMYINIGNEAEVFGGCQLSYNTETKKFESTLNLGGNSWLEGQHYVAYMEIIHDGYAYEVSYEGEISLWTYTNNLSDKVSPVLNGLQVLVNGVPQTTKYFNLKPGDVITVRADVTEDSQVWGYVHLYPNMDYITTSQFIEMSNADSFLLRMDPSEYDLEGTKTISSGWDEGEFYLYYVMVGDKYSNSNTYYHYEDEIVSLYKEVAKNPSNAGLVENETTNAGLNNIAGNIASIVAKDGAVSAATKANVEAALAAGDTISVDLNVSTIPANSVDKNIKAEIQKKADETFGADTKLVYVDISMSLVGSTFGNLGTLNELGEEISITVTIPAEAQGDYDYKIVRYHTKADGTIETSILDAVKNADGTLTFKTDRFSTYAIAYGTIAEAAPAPATPTSPTSPKTSDKDMVVIYLGFAVSAMAVVVYKRMRKNA